MFLTRGHTLKFNELTKMSLNWLKHHFKICIFIFNVRL